jgi:DNA-directed RNA polymerase specialized sigma24 family protein
MKFSSIQLRLEKQFDHFCKKIIINELRDIQKHNDYLLQNEKPLNDLSIEENTELSFIDKYDCFNEKIEVAGFLIDIEDELLYKAISMLSENKRKVILLSYWLDMSDKDISSYLNLVRRTVNYMRSSSLRELKKIMEGKI